MAIDPAEPRWPREQAADEIRRLIAEGEIGPKLPSHMQLAQRLGIAPMTVQKALGILRDAGEIVTRPGLGTFVAPKG